MGRVKFVMGFLWAAPVTLLSFLFYVMPFWCMGWYMFAGWRELAWCWYLNPKAPSWIQKKWKHWAGQTVGSLIIMKQFPDNSQYMNVILKHELTHVRQLMILGVFQPLLYFANWLTGTILKKTIGHVDGYFDNLMEINARRSAGQIVDVVTLTEKIKTTRQKNH